MLQGKIVKGIAGFYYVHVAGSGIYQCKAKGIFRKENRKPLVGDDVLLEPVVDSDVENPGNIIDILPRKNALVRPAVANVDQALVVFAVAYPRPNINLLDRFLVTMERNRIPSIICFNKTDRAATAQREDLRACYAQSPYPVLFASAETGEGVEDVRRILSNKTTTIAGPSGVGKSTMINRIAPDAQMETGEISEKIGRGRHTTRHAELIAIDATSYIVDTPGFTSLLVQDIKKEELGQYFPEFGEYEKYCRFAGCAHRKEPDCGIKQALAEGKISASRYRSYIEIYEELAAQREYK